MPPAIVADLAVAPPGRVESELLQMVVIPSEGEVPRKDA
jgi:hypothetical protein